jgi:hypothetical protein
MMRNSRDELHDELMAMLAASEELPAETREHLVEAFLLRMQREDPGARISETIRALYGAMVPVNLLTVLGIALAHGVVLFVMAHRILDSTIGMYPYQDTYMPAWIMFGVLWVLEVVVTLAAISAVTRQRNPSRKRQARHSRIPSV